MRLICSLRPRRDGTVLYQFGKRQWQFEPNAHGELSADVDDEQAVAHALHTGNFYPADAADEAAAEGLVQVADKPARRLGGRRKASDEQPSAPAAEGLVQE